MGAGMADAPGGVWDLNSPVWGDRPGTMPGRLSLLFCICQESVQGLEIRLDGG